MKIKLLMALVMFVLSICAGVLTSHIAKPYTGTDVALLLDGVVSFIVMMTSMVFIFS